MSERETPKPFWRWWLFCAALWVYGRAGHRSRIGQAAAEVFAWCCHRDWWVDGDEMPDAANDEVPF